MYLQPLIIGSNHFFFLITKKVRAHMLGTYRLRFPYHLYTMNRQEWDPERID